MTTATDISTTYEAPPRTEVGVLGWLKHNLFGSWLDTILTLVSFGLLYVILVPSVRWAVTEANWRAVTTNILILIHGPYPQTQDYRVFIAVGILVVLGIISVFVYRGKNAGSRQRMTLIWAVSPFVIWYLLAGFKGSSILPLVEYSKWGGLLLSFILAIFGIFA